MMINADYEAQDVATREAAPRPQSKGAGIATIVFGSLELVAMIVIIAAASLKAADFWWLPLVTAISMIVTGSLAIAAAEKVKDNSTVSIVAIVMASLNLAWVCVKGCLLFLFLLGLVSVQDEVDRTLAKYNPAVKEAMAGIWVAIVLYGIETLATFVCLVVILTTVGKVVCCRPSGSDQVAIVVREVGPAVGVVGQPPFSNRLPNQI